ELDRCKQDFLSVNPDNVFGQVDLQSTAFENSLLGTLRRNLSPLPERLDPELQFAGTKRFGEIIIDSHTIARLLVPYGRLFGEHYYRRRYAFFSKEFTQPDAIYAWHNHVENYDIGLRRETVIEPLYSVRGLQHVIASCAEIVRNHSANRFVVIDY